MSASTFRIIRYLLTLAVGIAVCISLRISLRAQDDFARNHLSTNAQEAKSAAVGNEESNTGHHTSPSNDIDHKVSESANNENDKVDFGSDILPLLSDRCFTCHGPDKHSRKAGLRLDIRDEAIDDAIVPNSPEDSELLYRIETDDTDDLMPPPDSGKKPLTEDEIQIFKKWIAEGAPYQRHWSFENPKRAQLPTVQNSDWPSNPIDRFVLAKLESQDLEPSPDAAKTTLARRAALTLTGLPPDPKLLRDFLGDKTPAAYGRFVDRLMQSPHYGERMAYVWMDAARYSDTDGFQIDEDRSNWPWRDWVINAYNSNMPFDQFTIEQTAGDLLPDATQQQILATCFHRNHMTNGEGGRDPAESRVDYVLDRINTVGKVWLGLTVECCQCHTHKYDPITQREYYQMYAFFNSIDEDGRAGKAAKPYLKVRPKDSDIEEIIDDLIVDVQKKQKQLDATEESLTKGFESWFQKQKQSIDTVLTNAKESDWKSLHPDSANTANISATIIEIDKDDTLRVTKYTPDKDRYTVVAKTDHATVGAIRLQAIPEKGNTFGGFSKSNSGNFVLTDFKIELIRNDTPQPISIQSAWADYAQPGLEIEKSFDGNDDVGWGVWSDKIDQPRTAVFRFLEAVRIRKGDRFRITLDHQSSNKKHCIRRFRLSSSPNLNAEQPRPTYFEAIRNSDSSGELSEDTRVKLLKYFLEHSPKRGPVGAQRLAAQKRLENARSKLTLNVMVLKERAQPRESHVLVRGVWDNHGEQVNPNTPKILGTIANENNSQPNRLDLARWLVSPENPLTARVTVNRMWQTHFGYGLVRTPQDFGLQGERPSHPKLLDWLAVEFMESGWDMKHIHQLIVTSRTFQQSSLVSAEDLQRDPQNRLLSRGPRYRLPAAIIRDQALSSSGMLTRKIGGPSVKPYQPAGVWFDANQGKFPYVRDKGKSLYRRSLYTFLRRNAMPPALFDGANRRVCQVRVVRTNSPMHALNLMNDTTYIEASRALAQRTMQKSETPKAWIADAWQRVLCRSIETSESAFLVKKYSQFLTHYRSEPQAASQLLANGDWPVDQDLKPDKLAALTMCCSIILNLDETLNLE